MRKRYTSCCLQALRFRRWSRRGYAAFVSRQRACTMGTLRCHIVERLQQKNGMPVAYGPACDCPYETADALAEDTGGFPADVLPAGMAFLVTACYGGTADAVAHCVVLSIDNEIFQREVPDCIRGFPLGVLGGRFFLERTLEENLVFALTGGTFRLLRGAALGRCHGGAWRWLLGFVSFSKETKVEKAFFAKAGFSLPAGLGRCHGGPSFFSLERKKRSKKSSRAHLALATSRPSLAKSPELAPFRSSNSVAFLTLSRAGLLNASLGKAPYRSIAARAPARRLCAEKR